VWDRESFQITNRDTYTNAQTGWPAQAPIGAWSASWATGTSGNTTTLVDLISKARTVDANDLSGYSNNNGLTWTQFGTLPPITGGSTGAWGGGIAAGSSTNFMYIQGTTATAPYWTKDSGTTWALMTGTPTLPTDGWGNTCCNNQRFDADRVTGSTFYAANNGATPGIYTCTISTSGTCTRTTTSLPGASGEPLLRTVPGNASNFFIAFPNVGFYSTTNGGTSFQLVNKFQFGSLTSFGFGSTFTGKSYPVIYAAGKDSTGTYGVWQCTDYSTSTGNCVQSSFTGSITSNVLTVTGSVTGTPLSVGKTIAGAGISANIAITSLGTGTGGAGTYNITANANVASEAMTMDWTNLGYANGITAQIQGIDGDQVIQGLVYGATNGVGAVYGYFPFLLKRDLDPSSNDNDPMWLEKAA
jgi:hypothetical protein